MKDTWKEGGRKGGAWSRREAREVWQKGEREGGREVGGRKGRH